MADSGNKFGLSRHIPEETKREVRARCGFGCVICGVTVTEYEHFYPDFAEAKVHDANCIALLCPTHHGLVTKGVLPKEQIAAGSKDPAAKQAGFSRYNHPWFTGIPSLKMGGSVLIQRTPIPIQVFGEDLLRFDPPEQGGDIARISASVRDSNGSQFLRVEQNEWQVIDGKWDFQFIGNRYIFKDASSKPMLILRMEAPDYIAIELLLTCINGMPIHITEDKVVLGGMDFNNCVASDCGVGFAFS